MIGCKWGALCVPSVPCVGSSAAVLWLWGGLTHADVGERRRFVRRCTIHVYFRRDQRLYYPVYLASILLRVRDYSAMRLPSASAVYYIILRRSNSSRDINRLVSWYAFIASPSISACREKWRFDSTEVR